MSSSQSSAPPPTNAGTALPGTSQQSSSPGTLRHARLGRLAMRFIRGVVLVLASVVLGYVWGMHLFWPSRSAPGWDGRLLAQVVPLVAPVCALLVVVPVLATAVHEGGHLLVGRLVGCRFHSCRVGPFVLTRTPRGLRLRLSKEGVYGGYARSLPADTRLLRLRYTLVVAAGPLVSLLLAVLTWQLVAADTDRLAPLGWLIAPAYLSVTHVALPRALGAVLVVAELDVVLLTLALGALVSAVLGTVPLKYRGRPNDGLLVLHAWRRGTTFERQLLLGALQGYASMGWRPRSWPASLVQRALALATDSASEYPACVYAYYWALDTGDIAGAGDHLDRAMAPYPSQSRVPATITLEAAYYVARYRRDVAAAREWAARGAGSRHEAFMRPRAEAAILLAEGRYAEALAAANASLAALAAAAPRLEVETAIELDSLREMATQAQQALASAGSHVGA